MEVLKVTNPMTNELLAELELSSSEQVQKMVDRAVAAQEMWAGTPLYDRAAYLYRMADAMEADQEAIAQLMAKDMAKPILQARVEAEDGIKLLRAAAERAKHLYGEVISDSGPGFDGDLVFTKREPLGTIACIIPFNYPTELTFQKVAPALVMGNTVLVKAPSSNPLVVMSFAKYAAEAGFPEGVLQFFVSGREAVNEKILANPQIDAVSLTGSTAAGKQMVKAGADTLKRMFLELGGNDALVIFDDTDLEKVLDEMVAARMENNGQVCCSSKRFVVQKGIYDKVCEGIAARLDALKRGFALEEDADVTCLVTEQAAITVEGQIQKTIEQGARLVTGGTRSGARIEPTVLADVTPDMDIASNMEVFGPVYPLIPFETEDEAIAIANNSIYGLSSGVMSGDLQRAFRVASKLKAGGAVINGTGLYRHLDQPFGGYKQSGLGREGISISLEEFSHIKVYVMKGAFC
ncbi:MAG: aldehyde dehydrogenase [Eubacterium sp.]|nr:aldehyde dehydrogenase [Eubacterium sp.]